MIAAWEERTLSGLFIASFSVFSLKSNQFVSSKDVRTINVSSSYVNPMLICITLWSWCQYGKTPRKTGILLSFIQYCGQTEVNEKS
jgi:hypothetical protein